MSHNNLERTGVCHTIIRSAAVCHAIIRRVLEYVMQ